MSRYNLSEVFDEVNFDPFAKDVPVELDPRFDPSIRHFDMDQGQSVIKTIVDSVAKYTQDPLRVLSNNKTEREEMAESIKETASVYYAAFTAAALVAFLISVFFSILCLRSDFRRWARIGQTNQAHQPVATEDQEYEEPQLTGARPKSIVRETSLNLENSHEDLAPRRDSNP